MDKRLSLRKQKPPNEAQAKIWFNALWNVLKYHFDFWSQSSEDFDYPWCPTKRWHGNASTRKRIKNKRKPLKNRFFWGVSAISSNFSEIPLNLNFEEFPLFFGRFTRIVYPFPLYFIQIFSRDFPIFLRGFPIFLIRFLFFLIRFLFF